MIADLTQLPAPRAGFIAQLIRALMDALLLYLPMFLLGREPATPSSLPFFSTGRYYLALVWLSPVVLTGEWLIGGALIHLILRLSGRESSFDLILNLTGMAALVVGAALLVWDWLWVALGGVDQVFLGITHLVIDIWVVVVVAAGLKAWFGVRYRFAVPLAISSIVAAFPAAVMFMRAPL